MLAVRSLTVVVALLLDFPVVAQPVAQDGTRELHAYSDEPTVPRARDLDGEVEADGLGALMALGSCAGMTLVFGALDVLHLGLTTGAFAALLGVAGATGAASVLSESITVVLGALGAGGVALGALYAASPAILLFHGVMQVLVSLVGTLLSFNVVALAERRLPTRRLVTHGVTPTLGALFVTVVSQAVVGGVALLLTGAAFFARAMNFRVVPGGGVEANATFWNVTAYSALLSLVFVPAVATLLGMALLAAGQALSAILLGSALASAQPATAHTHHVKVAPPRPEAAPVAEIVRTDSDADGREDHVDACPRLPEDVDGFQDVDGCPDPDNDGDGVMDSRDACPTQVGSALQDGCPVKDMDADGKPDLTDPCPVDPEDHDGVQDEDGCPER
ncbi:MAG: thrombospondin type 3 repeat-containing protein [Myxococcota bacterium]